MTFYPAIYCGKFFDVINHATFSLMTYCLMRLSTLQFEMKLQKCIRMGITIFKIFNLGGILSDILLKIMLRSRVAINLNLVLTSDNTSRNETFEYSYPLNI